MGWGIGLNLEVFRRLRLVLALWYAGVFFAVLAVLGAVAYFDLGARLVRAADEQNRLAILDLNQGAALQNGQLVVSRTSFANEAAEARSRFGLEIASLFDGTGQPLVHTGALGLPAAGPERETLGEWRVLRQPLVLAGRRVGTILVARALRERTAALAGLVQQLAVLIPLGVLLTLAAGTLLAGKALRPIREAFEVQRRFIADASHELRTPLAIVRAQAEAGQGGDETRALKAIVRSAERMSSLVDGLLLLTRADAAALSLARQTYFLDELVAEIAHDLLPLAKGRGVTLRVEAEVDVAVSADPELIRRLLLNLVVNALTYTPTGGTVTLWVQAQRAGVAVGVQDTGCGMSAEVLARVFERFYRGGGEAPGTGLGLAIALALAEAHGGRLEATSTVGRGSEFILELPA